MAVYRYLSYDLVTNTLQQELPVRDVSFAGVLDRAGTFSAVLPLNAQAQTAPGVFRSMAADLLTASQPGRTIVYVERDGVLVDGFIIWTRHYDPSTESCNLGGQSTWSYFGHRFNNTDLHYTATDQLTVFQDLINAAQAQSGGNIGVVVGTETSGVPHQGDYWVYEHKNVGDACQELAGAINGFDFSIDVAYVTGVPTKTLVCSYPSRGRGATASTWVFETGRNIVTYDWPEDATIAANRVFGVGAGDGVDQLQSVTSNTDAITAGFPLLDDLLSQYKDVSVQATLDGYTAAAVTARAFPATIPTVTVLAGGDPPLGAWIVGDYAQFVFGSDPAKPDPRFPTKTTVTARIVGYEATPGNEGQETVVLVLN